jgi:hypothetical protein
MAKVDMIAIILCKSSRQTFLAIAIPASLGMLTHLPSFNWARVLVASNFMRNAFAYAFQFAASDDLCLGKTQLPME